MAVERERAIAENELASQIELARREEQLVDQRGTNARREAEERAAADAVKAGAEAARTVRLTEAEAERTVRLADAEATRSVKLAEAEAARQVKLSEAEARAARVVGAARAEAQAAWLRVHAEVDASTLHALTGTRLAENLPRIESVTVSPDVLTGLLSKLGGTGTQGGSA